MAGATAGGRPGHADTYRLDADGPQYLVIAAGGHDTMGTTPGDHLIAFALRR